MNEQMLNLQRLSGIAVNRFGITIKEFYQMTPSEFQYALKDYVVQADSKFRIYMEGLRFHALQLFRVSGNIKRGVEINEKLIPLAWDEKEGKKTVKQQSITEIKSAVFGIANFLKSKKRKSKK
jgi:hypothetical protein